MNKKEILKVDSKTLIEELANAEKELQYLEKSISVLKTKLLPVLSADKLGISGTTIAPRFTSPMGLSLVNITAMASNLRSQVDEIVSLMEI